MKDFFSLCSEIYARGAGQKKKDQYDDEKNFDNQFYHPRRYDKNRSKSVFVLMMVGMVGIAAGCLVLFVNPYDLIFKFKIILSDGGEIFEIWREPPVELYLRVFLFNVTNREAFLEGREKLHLQEVGPYVYRERFVHTNISFNANGTMTSIPMHPLQWVPELSNGTEEDVLILPNIALLSFANVMLGKSYFSQMGVNLLIRQTDTHPLVNMTAKEFMFGYKSTLVTLGNKVLPSWIAFDKLGLIDRMYDFDGDVATIYTGETDIGKTGLLATYNRSPKLPQWDLPCGDVRDSSDGTKFPSFIQLNDTLRFYRKSLCRPMKLERFGNETTRGGLRAFQYRFAENSLDNGEFVSENKCFCRRGKCLPRGLADVTECYYGFPIALSYPHLLNTDPSVVTVEGMQPNPEKHDTFFMIQPESGLPLEVAVRMQINMALGDVSPISRCGPFKNMVLPLLWTEIRMYHLPQSLSTRFSIYINLLPIVQDMSIYLLFVAGAALVLVALIKLVRKPDDINPIPTYNTPTEKPELKSPLFNSKDVISEIIDEGRQVFFGKKSTSVKPKSNVYRETVRQRSSMNLFGFLKREPQLRKQLTKEDLYDVRKNKESAKAAAPLKLSSDSDTDSAERKTYFAEANVNFSASDDSLNLTDAEDKLVQRLTSPTSSIERREDERRDVPT